MKKSQIFATTLVGLIFLISLGFATSNNYFPGVQDQIPVDKFSSISVSVPATVYVEIGNKHSLDIKADKSVIEKLEIKVSNDELIISKKDKSFKIKDKLEIHITAPKIEGVSVAGSADVLAEKSFPADELVLKIAGSGTIMFNDLKADELEVKIAGSGDVVLKGSGANEMEISIAGSGNVESLEFEVHELSAKISGSGDCKVFVTGELNATIAGSGSVKYKGSPEVNSTVSGSGTVSTMK